MTRQEFFDFLNEKIIKDLQSYSENEICIIVEFFFNQFSIVLHKTKEEILKMSVEDLALDFKNFSLKIEEFELSAYKGKFFYKLSQGDQGVGNVLVI
jgi:hypothetical protein